MNTPSEIGNLDSFGEVAGTLVASLSNTAVAAYLEVLKHPVDAFFTWSIGVVTGIQDVIQTVDMAHCKLPDFYMKDVFRCSCGDSEFKIPDNRAEETYTEGAFWCSGTLNMLGYDQNPVVIFNPLSYRQLQSRLVGLDTYLECISGAGTGDMPSGQDSSCEQYRPSVQVLEEQGVSSIAVLTRSVHALFLVSIILERDSCFQVNVKVDEIILRHEIEITTTTGGSHLSDFLQHQLPRINTLFLLVPVSSLPPHSISFFFVHSTPFLFSPSAPLHFFFSCPIHFFSPSTLTDSAQMQVQLCSSPVGRGYKCPLSV